MLSCAISDSSEKRSWGVLSVEIVMAGEELSFAAAAPTCRIARID